MSGRARFVVSTIGAAIVAGTAAVAWFYDAGGVPGELIGEVKTFCGIVQPTTDDIRKASLEVLYPKVGYCSRTVPSLTDAEVQTCRDQIGRLSAWVRTLDDKTTQYWYNSWLKYYSGVLDERYGHAAAAAARREAYASAEAAARARVEALADCLPKPPEELQ